MNDTQSSLLAELALIAVALIKGLIALGVVGAIVTLVWLEEFEGPVLA